MKLVYLGIFLISQYSCKRGQEATACVKSFVETRSIKTYGLELLPGGERADSIGNSSSPIVFTAGGIFKSLEREKPKNCGATFVFAPSSGGYSIEVLTASHCVGLLTKGPYKLYASGEDGYREIEIIPNEIDNSRKIVDGFLSSNLAMRAVPQGISWRPFESSELRNKIGNKELSRSIEQELGSYAGKLCGLRGSSPTEINAKIGCFMFGDLVSFKATPKPGSEDAILSIKKSGNIASDFLASADQNWMNEVRLKYSVIRDLEIGRFLSTIYDCSNPKDMQFDTSADSCSQQKIESAKSFLSSGQSQGLFANSLFDGYALKSDEQKKMLIQQSIDNHAASYGRQVAYWQSMRQKLQKGTLSLGANYVGPKGPKYQLANLKDFQGEIPFIWRPYGILGYIDNSMAKLDKGVSGSMVFLDGTPVAVISRIDGENTSSGSGVPSTGESKLSELNIPIAAVFSEAEWKAKNTANTASVDTTPVILPSTTTPSTVGSPDAGPSALPSNTSNPSPRRTSADASESLQYGGSTPGC
jgi:hypothetical protein